MARGTHDIEQQIEQKRHEIDEDIAKLRQELLERTDWRWQVRSKPFVAIGLALGLGLLAGLVFTR